MTNEEKYMKVTIDIKDYLNEEEIKNVCKDTLTQIVYQQYSGKEADVERWITNLSYEFIFKAISEIIGNDSIEIIKEKVYHLLNNDSVIKYELFRRNDAWGRSESPCLTILNQAIKDNESLIRKRVEEEINKYDLESFELKYRFEEMICQVVEEKLFGNSKLEK